MTQSDPLVINNIEDLFNYVVTELHQKYPPEHVVIGDDFVITIKLVGKQWQGGYVDHRIAQYIIRLQNDLLRIYNEVTGEHVTRRSPKDVIRPLTVRVKVEEGSSLINIDFAAWGMNLLHKMSSTELFILACLAIVGWVWNKTFSKKMDIKRELELKKAELRRDIELKKIDARTAEIRAESLRRAVEIAPEALHVAKAAQNSTRYLINCLDAEDKYVVEDREFSKKEAKEKLPPKPTTEPPQPKTYQVDGNFSVLLQDLRTFSVKVRAEDYTFPVDTNMLDEDDKKALQARFAEASIHQKVPELRLRLALRIDPETNQILDGSLIRLNPPEDEGTKDFKAFLDNLKGKK